MSVDGKLSPLSFIYPRKISVGLVDGFRLSLVGRNLLSDFDACEGKLPGNELMKVFLRVRPLPTIDIQPTLKPMGTYNVVACPPENKKLNMRENKKSEHNFTFTRVFDSSSSQSTLFSAVAVEQVRGFLEGLNGLVFAYGTTSSGKTFTLQGTLDNFGMIPRALCILFSAVNVSTTITFMPKDYGDFVPLNSYDIDKILRNKNTLLKLCSDFPEETLNNAKDDISLIEKLATTKFDHFGGETPFHPHACSSEQPPSKVSNDYRFVFWMSFAEVYNELVFDLLDPVHCVSARNAAELVNSNRNAVNGGLKNVFSTVNASSGLDVQHGRMLRKHPLELKTDKNGNVFIRGLNCYPVSSAEEAMRLLLVGRRCQQVAATRLNQSSSRSHSILTIQAVRVANKENPKFARISRLTFCDLAGSERSVKAATGGDSVRLREAGNINNSLLTLGRCIECLRYNQIHPDNPRPVPYRDSKLTRLFQGFFTGRGKACMIVNASSHPELFDETLHALRFSALATRIIVRSNAVVDTTLVQSDEPTKDVRKKYSKSMKTKPRTVLKSANSPVTATPPTVVPKRPASNWHTESSSSDQENTVYEENSIDVSNISSGMVSGSPHTPENSQFRLDDYDKDELIFMVNELSEKLFESKGELIEQEIKLRQEMCEAMNKQMVEFERIYDEAWSTQEKVLMARSQRRLQGYARQAQKLSTSHSRRAKRLREDSDSSDDDDTVLEDQLSTEEEEEREAPDDSHLKLLITETELKEARERIRDLESTRDRLRMEATRLEFTNINLQKQLSGEKANQAKKACVDCGTQTNPLQIEVNLPLKSQSAPVSPPTECGDQQRDMTWDDSTVVRIHLPKSRLHRVGNGDRRVFFDSHLSPEHEMCLPSASQTPPTVVRVPILKPQQTDKLDDQLDRLRCENQQLLIKLSQIKQQQQPVPRDRLESTRISSKMDVGPLIDHRMSEGLQSFVEHESQFQQLGMIEELQQRIAELEEMFAKKHDALLSVEHAKREAETEIETLTQRLLTQLNEISRWRDHCDEISSQHERQLEQVRKDEEKLRLEAVDRNRARVWDNHCEEATQADLICDWIESSVQTTPKQTHDTSLQVSLEGCYEIHHKSSTERDLQGVHQKRKTGLNNAVPSTDNGGEFEKPMRPKRGKRKPLKLNLPKLPSIPSPVCVHRLSSDTDTSSHIGQTTDLDEEDPISCESEPVRPHEKPSSKSRRAYSSSRAECSPRSANSRTGKARSVGPTRRLPPLTESSKLTPDSFFQVELDAALDKIELHVEQEEELQLLRGRSLRPRNRR